MFLRISLFLALTISAATCQADDNRITLEAPDALSETGFLDYLLPRFSLKTGVRIALSEAGGEARFSEETGTPVFRNAETVWHFDYSSDADTEKFIDWLRSEVGANTISAFELAGKQIFTPTKQARSTDAAVVPDADVDAGERLSLTHCGRCHVVNDSNRMKAIGSTPSFAVLRTMPRWTERFEVFYVLKPHGAFTQIEDVTPPFDPARPSPIAPVEITLGELDAIMAYVATVDPADLGAPIQSQ